MHIIYYAYILLPILLPIIAYYSVFEEMMEIVVVSYSILFSFIYHINCRHSTGLGMRPEQRQVLLGQSLCALLRARPFPRML
jgi:hypothetical protein